MNQLDDDINRMVREMVRERVDAAPPPPSLATIERHADRPSEAAASASPPTSLKRLLAMAASIVIVVALGAAILVGGDSGDDDLEPAATLDTLPSVPSTTEVPPTTASPSTTEPPSGSDGTPEVPLVEIDPDGITIAAGAIFGLIPGRGTGPDDVVPVVNARLGEPDQDTGWIDPRTEFFPCRELTEYREIRWGDLTMGFWERGTATYFHFWAVGDRRTINFILPDIDMAPPNQTTGFSTDDGVRVGDGVGRIPDGPNVSSRDVVFSDDVERLQTSVISTIPGADPNGISPTSRSGSYLSQDGIVLGFGSESFTC